MLGLQRWFAQPVCGYSVEPFFGEWTQDASKTIFSFPKSSERAGKFSICPRFGYGGDVRAYRNWRVDGG